MSYRETGAGLPPVRIALAAAGAHKALEKGIYAVCPSAQLRLVAPDQLARARLHSLLWDVDGVAAVGGIDGNGSMEGMAAVARYARQRDIPFLGLGAGVAAAVLDYIQDVLGLSVNAADVFVHNGYGRDSCRLLPGSMLAAAYGQRDIEAQYIGEYGLRGPYRAQLERAGLRVAAEDPRGDMAAAELARHKFYVGARFLPAPAPDPLLRAFCAAAEELARTRPDGL